MNLLHRGPLCLLLLMLFRITNPVQIGVWFISPHDVRDDSKQTCSSHTIFAVCKMYTHSMQCICLQGMRPTIFTKIFSIHDLYLGILRNKVTITFLSFYYMVETGFHT